MEASTENLFFFGKKIVVSSKRKEKILILFSDFMIFVKKKYDLGKKKDSF